jgi:hypothetical protein
VFWFNLRISMFIQRETISYEDVSMAPPVEEQFMDLPPAIIPVTPARSKTIEQFLDWIDSQPHSKPHCIGKLVVDEENNSSHRERRRSQDENHSRKTYYR